MTLKCPFIFLLSVFLLSFFSCIKEIEIETPPFDSKLVLSSLLTPDSQLVCYFSSTAPITGSCEKSNHPLHVKIYANGHDILMVDTIVFSDTLYTGIKPPEYRSFSIEAQREGFNKITAEDELPQRVDVAHAEMKNAGITEYGMKIWDIAVTFTDPPGEKNYYELMFACLSPDGRPGRYWSYDGECEQIDPVLIAEGNVDYDPASFFFSDELFDGQTYTMKIKHSNTSTCKNYGVVLRSVSRNYYEYRKNFTRHNYNKQVVDEIDFHHLLFLGEPQNAYSNVENGYGIFAAYRSSLVKKMNVLE